LQRKVTSSICVEGLSRETTEPELRRLFEHHGEVASVTVITDNETGRPKGFAFVEMIAQAAADEAISHLNGAEVSGRKIMVTQARPRKMPC
jgi:RNA recognition motif-containing protein